MRKSGYLNNLVFQCAYAYKLSYLKAGHHPTKVALSAAVSHLCHPPPPPTLQCQGVPVVCLEVLPPCPAHSRSAGATHPFHKAVCHEREL